MYSAIFVDGKMMMHRQFAVHHKVQNLSTKVNGKTIYTGMLFGTLRTVIALQKEYDPDSIIFLHDSYDKILERKEKFSEYKENRNKTTDEEFERQMSITIGALCMLGITNIKAPGFEADDLIATFVERNIDNYKPTLIVSSDKDLQQLLVKNKVFILRHSPKKLFQRYEDFIEKFGFIPQIFPIFQAVTGDKGDNIPRVGKYTELKAFKLFEELKANLKEPEEIEDELSTIFLTEGLYREFMMNLMLTKLKDDIPTSAMVQLPKDRKIDEFWNLMEELKFRSMLTQKNKDILETINERNKDIYHVEQKSKKKNDRELETNKKEKHKDKTKTRGRKKIKVTVHKK